MSWHCKASNAYARNSAEARDNATEIVNICSSLGWAIWPICAMLGNMESESGYNPWRWQGDVILPVGDPRIGTIGGGNTAHAYGLCQQDPAAKYIYRTYAQMQNGYGPNYSDQAGSQYDGYAQMQYLHWICSQNEAGGEWLPNAPLAQGLGVPFADFIANTPGYTIAELTRVFFGCYERGRWDNSRVSAASHWRSIFDYYDPVDPDVPPGTDSQAAWFGVFKILSKKRHPVIGYQRKAKNGSVIK